MAVALQSAFIYKCILISIRNLSNHTPFSWATYVGDLLASTHATYTVIIKANNFYYI